MARPGRSEDTSEDTSVPIWLKLSATDSAKMDQVLARPEFEGWTKGEWCLEIIQTALRYYTKPRPAGEPGRKRAPAPPAAEPSPTPAETTPPPRLAEPEPPPAETTPPGRAAPSRVRPARDAAGRPPTAAKRMSPSRGPERVAPERPRLRQPPEPEQRQPRRAPEPEQAPSRRAAKPKPPPPPEPGLAEPGAVEAGSAEPGRVEAGRVGSEPFGLDEVDSLPETECPHPAEARDYQSGTCAACGAILWD